MSAEKQIKNYCEKCPNRSVCIAPCPPVEELLQSVMTRPENKGKPPEDYVNQKTHRPFCDPKPRRTKKQVIKEMFFTDHRKQWEIAIMLETNKHYVCKIINEERRRNR